MMRSPLCFYQFWGLFFHCCGATFITKETSLMPGFQSGTKSNQPEQDHTNYSELNISLAECHLGVIWKETIQDFWLFKTAVISHETTECGLRPGLAPHCPNCWEAEVGEFPWMVSVQLSFSHFCAGSILNEQWILTTARCANFIKNSEALALVQVGLVDLQEPAQAQTVGIHRAMPYLGPKGPLGPGLIFLKQPLHFQPLVLPICLKENVEQEKSIQLYDCWLPSWSLMRGSPGILQKRHLSILQVSTCAQFWPKLNEFTFCVEAKKAMGEAGCKGDLGAPLVCHLHQKDTWVQGVTRPSHAPWSQQGAMTTSASISLSVSTSTNISAFTPTPASIRPQFISLPQPQTLADRISLQYAMPWQAMIISCGSEICSGSIVSSSWVLTAAHCVRNMNPEDTAVIMGLRHPGVPLRVVKVSNILLHERFRMVSGAARNDLALLLLQEVQTPIQLLAPLGHLKNLNSSECWLSGPRVLKPGETDESPEMLQMQVMGASSCAHLYPDIGSSIVCFITQEKISDKNVEPVTPGSAVMCRPISGNGSWRQIGITSLKALATIVSPHFSWILSTSAKAGHPLNQALMPWAEKPKSSSLYEETTTLQFSLLMIITVQSLL
uniref:Peptidase S1 domain-containing protein n=2 Tax=Canis lupus familiaris TaxID=9615 RepID=A0A8C0RKR4_CANLF